jgi:peptide/nickel transport system ATP-binding protein
MMSYLELRNVTKIFSGGMFSKAGTVALDNFSFAIDVESPSINALVGESGSGKTTIALLMLGFITPTTGEMLYKGQNFQRLPSRKRQMFRREVQAIFQDPFGVYNPFYKVDHVFDVPIAKLHLASSPAERQALKEEALRGVGLRPEETLGRYPHQLSGGQRQRITVARALLMRPKFIVADEPVSMVDASLRATILESITKLNRELHIPILYITHDLTTAYHVCDNIIILYLGSMVESGDVEQVIKTPKHPYTQLLVGSIPWPDPTRRWGEGQVAVVDREATGADNQCKFAPRCPFTMPICRERHPPLFQGGNDRTVACYLYKDKPVVELAKWANTFL